MIRFRIPIRLFLVIIVAVPILVILYSWLVKETISSAHRVAIPTPHHSHNTASPALANFKGQEEVVVPDQSIKEHVGSVVQPRREVEIWGKASIAEYLWGHVLRGNATSYANGLLKHGEITLEDLHLTFRSGPGVIQNTVPSTVKYLVLVLNGKDDVKIRFAKSWLDYLVQLHHLRKVALVMLGNEACDNDWLLPYLRSRGGPIDVAFIVYSSPLVDNKEVYQWPLGVATYRGFPHFRSDLMQVKNERQHLCNFLGTVYKNSSREKLVAALGGACVLQTRDSWLPSETYASMERYIRVLSDSDLTLSPAGKNTECYRIYEAMALGSVPIIEDVLTNGSCASPLRLLKFYKAPVTYVKSWDGITAILEKESKMSHNARIARRSELVKWYERFKKELRQSFLQTIRRVFFNKNFS